MCIRDRLTLTRNIAAVALSKHVLATRLDGRTGDDLVADSTLDGNLEQLQKERGQLEKQLYRARATGDGYAQIRFRTLLEQNREGLLRRKFRI